MSIFEKEPPEFGEIFDTLLKHENVEIKHIISSSKFEDKEYVQECDEFVMVILGKALLDIKGKRKELKAGEYLFIKAHTKHKVLKTKKGTHWLAIYIKPSV